MPRKISNSEKVKLVLSSFRENVVITAFCEEHRVSRSTFYRWRKLVLNGLSAFMIGKKGSSHGKNFARPASKV